MSKVKIVNNCWIWTSAISHGYGNFKLKNKSRIAHRVSFELFIGDIPNGKQLDHLCRNKLCVNPEHIEPVTCKENINRGNSGINNSIKICCPKGHSYSGKDSRGYRVCKTCIEERRFVR